MKQCVVLATTFFAAIGTSAELGQMSISEAVTAELVFLYMSLSLFHRHISERRTKIWWVISTAASFTIS